MLPARHLLLRGLDSALRHQKFKDLGLSTDRNSLTKRLLAACAAKSLFNIGFSACLVFISLRLVNSLVDTSQVGLELVNRLPSILKINRVLPVEHRPGGPARNLPNDTP